MSSRNDFGNFDLGRLTVPGWLAFLLAIAAALAGGSAVGFTCLAVFPAQERDLATKIGGIAGAGCALGFFFAAKAMLHAMGVVIVRPKTEPCIPGDSDEFSELHSRLSQAKKWRLSFLVSMPLALLLTCGIALALAYVPVSPGFTHFHVLGIGAVALPILLAGCLLMHSDVGRHAQALAAARQAGTRKP